MPDFLRVRDKDTGHEYTIRAGHLDDAAHTVIDKPALDAHGEPAAMKPRRALGKRSAAKKTASRGTKSPAPATKSGQEDNGQPADSEQENS